MGCAGEPAASFQKDLRSTFHGLDYIRITSLTLTQLLFLQVLVLAVDMPAVVHCFQFCKRQRCSANARPKHSTLMAFGQFLALARERASSAVTSERQSSRSTTSRAGVSNGRFLLHGWRPQCADQAA